MSSSQNAEQLKKQTQEQADKVSADAKQTANKVSNVINKEAEEIESHAKSAGKEISKGFHSSVDHIHDAFNKFVSNPKYWASTLSVVNAVVLGAAGYFAYLHRNQVQTWDKKLLSAIAVGVATFVGGESYLATAAAKKQSNK